MSTKVDKKLKDLIEVTKDHLNEFFDTTEPFKVGVLENDTTEPVVYHFVILFKQDGEQKKVFQSFTDDELERVIATESFKHIGWSFEEFFMKNGFVKKDDTDWNQYSSESLAFSLKCIVTAEEIHINEKIARFNTIVPILKKKLDSEYFFNGKEFTLNTFKEINQYQTLLGLDK